MPVTKTKYPPKKIKPKGNLQKAFKEFSTAQFKQVRPDIRDARREAVGLMTPEALRNGLKTGKDVVLAYGRSGEMRKYTLSDLKKFARAADKASTKFDPTTRGITAREVIAYSASVDVRRANGAEADGSGISGTPHLYRVINGALHFKTSGSRKNGGQPHQVRIKLEEWDHELLKYTTTYIQKAKAVLNGRVSMDCDCGRWQYWYRFLATAGGYALKPYEFDFPKIRNPKLTGCACKHIIKTAANLNANAIIKAVAKEIERVAGGKGFGNDKLRSDRFLDEETLKKTGKIKSAVIDHAEVKQELQRVLMAKMKTAQNALIKQAKSGKYRDIHITMKNKAALKRTLVTKVKAATSTTKGTTKPATSQKVAAESKQKAMIKTLQDRALKAELYGHLMKTIYKDRQTKDEGIKSFAEAKKLDITDVKKLAVGMKV